MSRVRKLSEKHRFRKILTSRKRILGTTCLVLGGGITWFISSRQNASLPNYWAYKPASKVSYAWGLSPYGFL